MNTKQLRSGIVGLILGCLAMAIAPQRCLAQTPVVAKAATAVEALQPLAALVGDYATSNIEYRNPAKDDDDVKSTGTIRCQLKARGNILTIEKVSPLADGSQYDDLMVFQFDKSAGKLKATLFHPGAPGPRGIEVELDRFGKATLLYEPTKFGDQTIVTRETITPVPGGVVTWLVERKTGDGEFVKVRHIHGKRE